MFWMVWVFRPYTYGPGHIMVYTHYAYGWTICIYFNILSDFHYFIAFNKPKTRIRNQNDFILKYFKNEKKTFLEIAQ